ncbi:MAG TPA: hypothetical protein VEY30_08060 [Myxococcaceae bacterium]|nr:hypothetical protein [Myxococcaceae bacterium]
MTWVLLLYFALAQVAAVDALYYHLWKYRLFERPETRREHWLHTAMSAAFVGVVWGLWCARSLGAWWWVLAIWQGATLAISLWDVALEPQTRARFGGLSGREYFLHMLMNALHGMAWAVWLAVTYADAQQPTGWGPLEHRYPLAAQAVAWVSLAAAVAMPALHLWLGLHPRWAKREGGTEGNYPALRADARPPHARTSGERRMIF